MICPDCHGTKQTIADHVSYANGRCGFNVPMRCDRCDGTGEVPDAMADWITRGRAMRDRRVNGNYRTLRAEAERRGISMTVLSKMEWGKIEPIEEMEGPTKP